MPTKGKIAQVCKGGGDGTYNKGDGAAHTKAGHSLRNLRERREAESTTPPSRVGERDKFQVLFGGLRSLVSIKKKIGSIHNEDPGELWGSHLVSYFFCCSGEGAKENGEYYNKEDSIPGKSDELRNRRVEREGDLTTQLSRGGEKVFLDYCTG